MFLLKSDWLIFERAESCLVHINKTLANQISEGVSPLF
jgi:hypothetical protein